MGISKKERKRRRELVRELEARTREELRGATDTELEVRLQSLGVFKQPIPQLRQILPGKMTLYESGARDSALIMSTWVVDELERRYPGTKISLRDALVVEFERQGIPVPAGWRGENSDGHRDGEEESGGA